jgi:hypothetical protein
MKQFISFKTRAKREQAVTWWNPAAQTRPVLTNVPLPPYSRFPVELASILLLSFLLFALVAALSHCLCSESAYLSIKLYRIYVCYTNITLYETESKIFRTGAAIYTEFVLARSTGRW